jgi:hypothetical protein
MTIYRKGICNVYMELHMVYELDLNLKKCAKIKS